MEKEINKMVKEIIEADKDLKAHTKKLSREERACLNRRLRKDGRKGKK